MAIERVNVAQEHFTSAVTQFIMAQLYPKIFSGVRTDKKLIAASMGNELIQVIINIVNNDKGALLENKIDKPEIYLKTSKNDNNIVLEIEDNADGLPDGIKDRIFEAYFTTKDLKRTGIGLHMSKMIMKQTFDGKLKVTNKDECASFALQFPQ